MVIETDLRADVLEWLDTAFGETNDLAAAAGRVAERIISEGHADAFVREFGPEVLGFWWRHKNASDRRNAAEPGTRRVDNEALKEPKSMLETLEKAGGEWFRLGDFDRAMCREAQRSYHKQGEGNLRKSFMFSKLADGLKGSKTVRAVFSDEQVRGFLAEFRLE